MDDDKETLVVGHIEFISHIFDTVKEVVKVLYSDVDYPPTDMDIEELVLGELTKIKNFYEVCDDGDPIREAVMWFFEKISGSELLDTLADEDFTAINIEITDNDLYYITLRRVP